MGQASNLAEAAGGAFASYSQLPAETRAAFLDRIATAIEELGEPLLQCASEETSLPLPRLTGERGRTCAQLRMFAALLREGSWVDARIETADPARTPIPKPDLRRMLIPLGPVAVFGASNFPLAFSVAGGDTASALAAGCPVVYKPNPGHPKTSLMVANAVNAVVTEMGLPAGTFGMVDESLEAGKELALDPHIKAIGFTGSLRGGRALFDLAASRPEPIPVYAEMGSVNPVIVLPDAAKNRAESIGHGYAQSLTLGVGQFCTNPGLLIGIDTLDFDRLVDAASAAVRPVAPAPMLHAGIHANYIKGLETLASSTGVTTLVEPQPSGDLAAPALFESDSRKVRKDPSLLEEVFGPSGVVIRCKDMEDLRELVRSLPGQLTGSVFADELESDLTKQVLHDVASIAGRVILNGFPTGVEVNTAMQHGGPYPATTDSRSTSVGTAAITRFARPVSFQGWSSGLLPKELQDGNPLGIWRLVNGKLGRD